MQATIQTLSLASATNYVESRNLMEQILQAVTRLSLGTQDSNRIIEVQDESAAQKPSNQEAHLAKPESEPCNDLMDTVARLYYRVNDNQLQGKIMSREAKDIIRDLLLALGTMSSEEFLEARDASTLTDRGICSACCRRHISDLRTSLTTVYAALLSTRQVVVNYVGRQHTSGLYNQSNWKTSTCELGAGTLSVLSRTRSRKTQQLSQLGQLDSQILPQTEEEEVTTSISLVSGRSRARHAIKVYIRQTHDDNSTSFSIPCLFVYNVLPADSPVFRIVQQGQLSEFQALLQAGKASLRDQDECGASLLFVSVPLCIDLQFNDRSLLIVLFSMRLSSLKCVDT